MAPTRLVSVFIASIMWEHLVYRDRNPNPLKAELNANLVEYVESDNADGVKNALNQGADVNSRRRVNGRTALMIAASKGNEEIMGILLSHGASVHATDTDGNFAIHLAAEQGHLGCVKLLMDKGSLSFVGNLEYRTPLMKAAAMGHADVVEHLLLNGVNMMYQLNKHSESELTLASQAGHVDVVRILLKHSKPGVDRSIELNRALQKAVFFYEAEVVEELLSAGADVAYKDESSASLLSVAVRNEDLETLKCLVEHGADVNQRDENNCTPMKEAIKTGNSEIVERKLKFTLTEILKL
ncbi:hypothetical protein Aperf_G00000129852 [Anoplocephala perfoliata]